MAVVNIGGRIKSRRKELHYTQEELAQRMNYKSRSTINKIENGINKVTKTSIYLFAEKLNTSLAYLVGFTDDPDADKSTDINTALDLVLKRPSAGLTAQRPDGNFLNISFDSFGGITAEIQPFSDYVKSDRVAYREIDSFHAGLIRAYDKASVKDQALVRTILEIDEDGNKVTE